MGENVKPNSQGSDFYLSKWFLDFVGESGEAMIFYAARLTWRGWSASYTSWLNYEPVSGVCLKSRFHHVHVPEITDRRISWRDAGFNVSGTWDAMADKIEARIFDSPGGFLDWICYQPASKVKLTFRDRVLEGRGYAEQLTLTAPPWNIPMNQLRWGRFGSDTYNMVWIELREKEKRQWLWLNGEQMKSCSIEDDHITIPEKGLQLKLDRGVSLESEKKIFKVVGKLIRYIPGFNNVMPLKFLMADETKWLSRGRLLEPERVITNGIAIHEYVNFKPSDA